MSKTSSIVNTLVYVVSRSSRAVPVLAFQSLVLIIRLLDRRMECIRSRGNREQDDGWRGFSMISPYAADKPSAPPDDAEDIFGGFDRHLRSTPEEGAASLGGPRSIRSSVAPFGTRPPCACAPAGRASTGNVPARCVLRHLERLVKSGDSPRVSVTGFKLPPRPHRALKLKLQTPIMTSR
ncbi:hypothetical protein C8R47DRAFT_304847 [Mycena vitilis]|nr:hypothetical protein C8R47DRAFT_304847 [Mycena vitilis]